MAAVEQQRKSGGLRIEITPQYIVFDTNCYIRYVGAGPVSLDTYILGFDKATVFYQARLWCQAVAMIYHDTAFCLAVQQSFFFGLVSHPPMQTVKKIYRVYVFDVITIAKRAGFHFQVAGIHPEGHRQQEVHCCYTAGGCRGAQGPQARPDAT